MKITKDNIKDIYKVKIVDAETMELKGYELIEELFVDSSGLGAENEPALTPNQFEKEVLKLIEKHGPLYATCTRQGQFQVYIGLFTKTGTKRTKSIGNNTILVNYLDGSKAVRLHNTDILTERNGYITLNTGGWDTRTTRARMNKHIPEGYRIYRRDWTTYIEDRKGNAREVVDGETRIKGEIVN